MLAITVAAALKFSVPLAIRGGGHHIAGFSTIDGGVLIDLSEFRSVTYDDASKTVSVQPGARLSDVDSVLARFSRCLPTGTVSDTGITGLTLGGGVGWLVTGYGLTCDFLASARVLLSDGAVITADSTRHRLLFSAVRGGGVGAFGVILELRFRTIELPRIFAGSIGFNIDDCGTVLDRVQSFIDRFEPRSMSIAPTIVRNGRSPRLSVDFCVFADHHIWLERFRVALGGDWRGIGERDYVTLQKSSDHQYFPPMRGYWKSVYFADMLPKPSVLRDLIAKAPSDGCSILLEYHNPTTLSQHSSGSFFPLRRAKVGVLVSSRWSSSDSDVDNIAWVRSSAEKLRIYAPFGAYSNYSPAGDESLRESYSEEAVASFEYLVDRYDPDLVFSRSHRARILGLEKSR